MSEEHPEVPQEEWDGRHIDWEDETCELCGSDLYHYGCCEQCSTSITYCDDSGETLFMA